MEEKMEAVLDLDVTQKEVEELILSISEKESLIDINILAGMIIDQIGNHSAFYFRPAILHLLDNGKIDITPERKILKK